MLDRIDAGDHGTTDRLGAVGMGGHAEAVVVRSGDHGLDLGDRHLRVVRAAAFVEDAARGHDLDQVGAVLVVLAHRLPGIGRRIDDAVLRAGVALQVPAEAIARIGVPAGRADRLARAEDARARHHAAVDRVAQGDRGIFAVAEIAHGGEAGLERAPGVDGAGDGVVGRVHAELVAVGRLAELHGQVGVAIDQAGQAGHAGMIDDAHVGGRDVAGLDRLDAFVDDDDRGRAEQFAGIGVEDMVAVQGDRGRLEIVGQGMAGACAKDGGTDQATDHRILRKRVGEVAWRRVAAGRTDGDASVIHL